MADIDALNIWIFYDPTRLKRVPATINFTYLISNYNLFDDYNIIHIAPSPTTQAKYTIKLSQPGLDLFSGATQKTYGKVCVNKTKWYLLEFKWDATGKWSLADNKAGLFLNPFEFKQVPGGVFDANFPSVFWAAPKKISNPDWDSFIVYFAWVVGEGAI